ncbi:MAG TPA: alpha/beta hydrolase-fold protein [Streptosporangiaceae bacterium]|nr:alpha/beta hydrolase-fold protein [Streptosporangiaceae bacterium]
MRSTVSKSLRVLATVCSLLAPLALVSQPAAAATSASDGFNRADGGLGSNWSDLSFGGLSISSQAVTGSVGLTGDAWAGGVFGADQFSQVELTSTQLTGGQWIGASVRIGGAGASAYTGLYFWNGGNPLLMLFRRTGGSWAELGNAVVTAPLPAGTTLEVTAVGSTISMLKNGATVISASDSQVTGGAPGVMAFDTATADNWSGGDINASGSGTGGGTGGGSGSGTYSVGGTVSGLSGPVVLEDNSGDDLTVSANGPFLFATQLASGASYNVTVKTAPPGQACTVAAGAGTITANITNITVTCTSAGSGPGQFSVTYEGTQSDGVKYYDVTSPDNGPGTQTLRVLTPTNPAPGVAHNFLFVLPVGPGIDSGFGDGIETMLSLNAQNQYNLTIVEPTFALSPWYADSPNDSNTQYESFMTDELVPWVQQHLATTGHEQNWLIGFSKSGLGGQDLILKHPGVFSLAASWDFPADMSSYDYCCDSAANYGTQANFQSNYRLTAAFVDAHKGPFLSTNRIWIGGYEAFQTDDSDYAALLTSEGIAHTTEAPTEMAHRWDSGWVPLALAALHQDSLSVGSP